MSLRVGNIRFFEYSHNLPSGNTVSVLLCVCPCIEGSDDYNLCKSRQNVSCCVPSAVVMYVGNLATLIPRLTYLSGRHCLGVVPGTSLYNLIVGDNDLPWRDPVSLT